jgi:hypothetical protein
VSGSTATIVRMANPATLLAEMLDQWRVQPGQSIVNVRRAWAGEGGDGFDQNLWRSQRAAVGHLQEIDDALSDMEQSGTDMSFYRAQMPRWHAATFGVANPWDAGLQNGYEIEADALSLLRALGHMLDATDFAPELTPDARADLIETLRESRDLVMEAQFPKTLAQTLMGLLREAEDAVVDYELSGSVKIRSTALKASGAMMMASTDQTVAGDPATVGKFRQVAGHIMLTIAVSSGTNVATDAMQELFHLAPPLAIEAPKQRQVEPSQADQGEVTTHEAAATVEPEDD